MATLVKEKRREKKKSKEKHVSKKETDLPTLINDLSLVDTRSSSQDMKRDLKSSEKLTNDVTHTEQDGETENKETIGIKESVREDEIERDKPLHNDIIGNIETSNFNMDYKSHKDNIEIGFTNSDHLATNFNTNSNIENVVINTVQSIHDIKEIATTSLEHTQNYSKLYENLEEEVKNLEIIEPDMTPSAPVLEQVQSDVPASHPVIAHRTVEIPKPKILCMPLEEAIRVYGGKEIAEVKAMSEREEALVEGGPVAGPEHPLVDLLSSFRLSLTAVEREKTQISCNLIEEEKARLKLWKIEKRSVSVSETCRCGANVDFKAVFDHAELLKEKLPAARMRLQAVLRDVQESYCHHQHAALLAYCQVVRTRSNEW